MIAARNLRRISPLPNSPSQSAPGFQSETGCGYTRGEFLADALIHAVGLVFALLACIGLSIAALPEADTGEVVALGLYAAGLVAMLGCSALYNMTSRPGLKRLFRRFDHAAIFVMIAGTYTPFALLAIGGAQGFWLFVFVWTVAGLGVTAKLLFPGRFERLSIAAYLLLGWTILTMLGPLKAAVPLSALILLAVGGVLYSVGVVFHMSVRLRYHNAIWHLFVLAAAVCHYAAVVRGIA